MHIRICKNSQYLANWSEDVIPAWTPDPGAAKQYNHISDAEGDAVVTNGTLELVDDGSSACNMTIGDD